MNPFALSGLLLCVSATIFGLLSFVKGTKYLNKVWGVFNFAIAIWGLGAYKFTTTLNQEEVYFWLHFGHIGVILAPALFFHFVHVFLGKSRKSILYLVYSAALFFSVLNIVDWLNSTTLFIADLRYVFNSFYVDSPPGPTYPFFVLFFAATLVYAHIILYKQHSITIGIRRMQIKYFLIASSIGFGGASSAYLMVFKIDIYPWLHFFAVLYPIIMTYAISKYRLMDIDVLIKKSLVFGGMLGTAFGVFVVSTLFVTQFLGGGSLVSLAISAFIIVLIHQPLEKWLVNATDTFLFQKEYDHQKLIAEMSRKILGKVDIIELKSFVGSFLMERMKLENIDVPDKIKLSGNALLEWHKDESMPLAYDELDYLMRKGRRGLVRLKDTMRELKTAVSVPVYLQNEPFWVLLLGNKKSGRSYSKEDINMLEALSHELTMALENARNFQKLKLSQLELLRQENLKFVSELVKGLAHEIFNPLTPLMHKIEDLEGEDLLNIFEIYDKNKSKLSDDEVTRFKASLVSLREATKAIKNNARHIHLIVDTLNRMQKGDDKSIGPIDIKSFFKEVIGVLGLEVDQNIQKGVVLTHNVEGNLPAVTGNPTLLKQILINLYKNSCQAMKNSSKKEITVLCRADDIPGAGVIIEFSDTGAGIPPEIASKIFDHGFSTKGSKGSGIGLSQGKTILEKFGGYIKVISKGDDKGSIFTIRLPAWKEEQANAG